jgi:glycosyltransferase involved in cell wall biosynthesis
MTTPVTVVIPCFNHGQFIDEAVDSVLAQTHPDIEIVIVDDGSDDPDTVRKLEEYRRPRTRVYRTENRGLSAARNFGISKAKGQYILPLDADDRIDSRYIAEAAAVLDRNESVGIVYCFAEFFGAQTGSWLLPPYSLEEMLVDNVIFCSALFRKADWEAVGGYDETFRSGFEDYDFWLSILELGRQVHQLPAVRFFYRVRPDSMLRQISRDQKVRVYHKIFQKHRPLFGDHIHFWVGRIVDYANLERRVREVETELSAIRQSRAWRTIQAARYFFYDMLLKPFPRLKAAVLNRTRETRNR